jgi:arginyl-tRNA synthetase
LLELNPDDKAVMVEYSSPNTNKPLHLGHRNIYWVILLQRLSKLQVKVYKTQIINDREFIYVNQCWLGRNWKWRNSESAGLKG